MLSGKTVAERLIGRPFRDTEVQAELQALDPRAEVDRDEDLFGWISDPAGVEITVDPTEETITGIYLFADGVDGHEQFAGELPGGLAFGWGRDQVQRRLGRPTRSEAGVDSWTTGNGVLFVEYVRDRVMRVVLALAHE